MRVITKCTEAAAGTEIPGEVTQAILHVIQEALTNAALYAGAEKATVKIWKTNSNIYVEVKDDGTGFNPNELAFMRSSLNGMYIKTCLAQGKLTLESAKDKGYITKARFPLEKQ